MIDADPTTEIRVKVADYAVGRDEQTLITIGLGSCVAIALYDPRTRIGGLAHTLLPSESMARDRSNPAKFPASAVVTLLAPGAGEARRRREHVRESVAGGRHQHRRSQRRRRSSGARGESRAGRRRGRRQRSRTERPFPPGRRTCRGAIAQEGQSCPLASRQRVTSRRCRRRPCWSSTTARSCGV